METKIAENGFKTAVRKTAARAKTAVAAITVFAAMLIAPSCAHAQTNPADVTAFYRYSKGQFYKAVVDTNRTHFAGGVLPITGNVSAFAVLYTDYNSPANKRSEAAVAAKAGPVDAAFITYQQYGPMAKGETDIWGSADLKGPFGTAACGLMDLKDPKNMKFGLRMSESPLTGYFSGSLADGKIETPKGRLDLSYGMKAVTPVADINAAWFSATEAANIRLSRLFKTRVGSFIPEIGIEISKRSTPSFRMALGFVPK